MNNSSPEANTFIDNYRQAMSDQYQAAQDELKQQRSNDYAVLMGNANKGGVMYSNFPERSKIKYDAQTYYPNLVKSYNTYQTGLDKLRSNVVNYQNQIQSLNDAIADLNKDEPKVISQSYY